MKVKEILQSKTVVLNLYAILLAIVTYSEQFSTGVWHLILPAKLIAILIPVHIIASAFVERFYPSGVLVGTGQNWTVMKWILNVAVILLGILQAADVVAIIPQQYLLIIVPALQAIIRIFGGANPGQLKAARLKQ